jgi:hypothetical protein
MLLGCFSSCTKCLSPRRERKAADGGQGPVSIPTPGATAPDGAPKAPQAPTLHNPSGLEPPFLINLPYFTLTGGVETIEVTVDYSLSVNVVTNKCLKKLGFEPLQHALPFHLSELAARELPEHCGWQRLTLYEAANHSREINFLVVSDNYRCDMLLGREFKGVKLNSGVGVYPNYKNPKSKGTLTRAQRTVWIALARIARHTC